MFYQYSNQNPFGRSPFQSRTSAWDKIKGSFRQGSALTRLIYINIALFFIIKIVSVILTLSGFDTFAIKNMLLQNLGVPASLHYLLVKPWTIISSMFVHFEFFHLLFNMLWLYWFGSLFMNYFSGQKLVGVYLLGGIAGALLYQLLYNVLPYFEPMLLSSWAIGASASVMAIVFAVCTYVPQQKIYLFLVGPVKLIHLALFTALIDLLSITSGNAGGHIAHLGGALLGYLFTLSIRSHIDITSPITAFFNLIQGGLKRTRKNPTFKRYKNPNPSTSSSRKSEASQDEINQILDKISKSGYESLSAREKEILFKSGRN